MRDIATIAYILLNLAVATIAVAAVVELILRVRRRGTLGRGLWASLLIGTGIVFLLVLSFSLSV
jgi:hypothetical protein